MSRSVLVALSIALGLLQFALAGQAQSSDLQRAVMRTKRAATFVQALTNYGLKNPKTMEIAKQTFEGEGIEPSELADSIEKQLKGKSYRIESSETDITITDSKSNEQLKLLIDYYGCEDTTTVGYGYLENVKQTEEQKTRAKAMVGHFSGKYADRGSQPIRVDTDITLKADGRLTGKYVLYMKGQSPTPGTLQQLGAVNGYEVLFHNSDENDDGVIKAKFSEDFSHFDGLYSNIGVDEQSWNGTRRTPAALPPTVGFKK